MFPADFSYARARSLDEALDLLDEAAAADEEAKLIAGGQSLLPMMKLRLAAPQVLIDIADLKELREEAGPPRAAASTCSSARSPPTGSWPRSRSLPRGPARPRNGGAPGPAHRHRPCHHRRPRRPGRPPGPREGHDRRRGGARRPGRRPPGGPARPERGGRDRGRPGRHAQAEPAGISPAAAARNDIPNVGQARRYPSTTSSRASTPRTWPKTRSSPTSRSPPQPPGAAPTRSSPTRRATFRWRASAAS